MEYEIADTDHGFLPGEPVTRQRTPSRFNSEMPDRPTLEPGPDTQADMFPIDQEQHAPSS